MGDEWLRIFNALPDGLQNIGRLQLLLARGLLAVGRLDDALSIIEGNPEVTDLRRGEMPD